MTGARVEHLPAQEALWRSNDFFVTLLSVPCIAVAITAFRFGVGGSLNLPKPFPAPRRRDGGKNGRKSALKTGLHVAVHLENQPYRLYIMG